MLEHRNHKTKIFKIILIELILILIFLTSLTLSTTSLARSYQGQATLQFKKFQSTFELNSYLNSHYPPGYKFSLFKKLMIESEAQIYDDSLIKQKNIVSYHLRRTFFSYETRKITSIFPISYIVRVVHNTYTDEIINLSGEVLYGP